MSKYGNRRTEVDGYKFDSQAEARRYQQLRLMERAGEIVLLEVHPSFDLNCAYVIQPEWNLVALPVCKYVADFSYFVLDGALSRMVVEDVKSPATRTAMYKLKKKWLRLQEGIEIQEIEA